MIQERRGVDAKKFFPDLLVFLDRTVTDKVITEDLSSLLTPEKFAQMRKVLKREVMQCIKDEFVRLS